MGKESGKEGTRDKPRPSKLLTIGAWSVVALLAPFSCAWILGRRLFWFDIVASEQMFICWILLLFSLAFFLLRRRLAAASCLGLLLVSGSPLLRQRELVLGGVDLDSRTEGTIRVVTLNIYPRNESWNAALDQVLALDADIIVLIEASPDLVRAVRRGLLDPTPYQYWAHRRWVDAYSSPCFLISRWPMEDIEADPGARFADLQLYRIIHTPRGDVAAGLVHPFSPRTRERYDRGNEVLADQVRAIGSIRSRLDLPMLVCADLNAGPAQRRAGLLRRTGLSMSKPLARYGASFPADRRMPGFMEIELDDVWTSERLVPIAWDLVEVVGSDHRAVVTDLKLIDE